MSFEWFIGKRYLKADKAHSFNKFISILSMVGIMVGVAVLVVVISVMSGAQADFARIILKVQPHVIVYKQVNCFSEYEKPLEEIKAFPTVTSASPFVYTEMLMRSKNGVQGAIIRGIDQGTSTKMIRHIWSGLNPKGRLPAGDNTGPRIPLIVLGKVLAENLEVVPGDVIYLISPSKMVSATGYLPQMMRLKVSGVFESGMYEYDKALAYVNLEDAQKLLGTGNCISGIEVDVKDVYKAGQIAQELNVTLGNMYMCRDWMALNHNFIYALQLQKEVMFIIFILIVLVAAFNVASTLIMMVMRKTKEIAILKAMGASHGHIRKIFMIKGMVIGSIGTGSGILLGILICVILKNYQFIELPKDVYPFTRLPVHIGLVDIGIIAIATLVICFLATLYPAHRASKLNPVDAIRFG